MMKKIIITLIFLIAMFNIASADSSMYYTGSYGVNIVGAINDTGYSAGSIFDLSGTDPTLDWYNKNLYSKIGGNPPTNFASSKIDPNLYKCNIDGSCIATNLPTPKKIIVTPQNSINYITQKCIDKGYVSIKNFLYTYKCSDDKTAFYICYKANNKLGYYEEPVKHLFASLKNATENSLRKGLNCYLNTSVTPSTTTPSINPTGSSTITDSDPSTILISENDALEKKNSKIIEYTTINPSLIEKLIYYVRTPEVNDYENIIQSIEKKQNYIPYFIINYYDVVEFINNYYKIRDIGIKIILQNSEQNHFNLNEEIYALIATPDNYENLITEINNFIKTENKEYLSTQKYIPIPIPDFVEYDCFCKAKKDNSSEFDFDIDNSINAMSLYGDLNSPTNKEILNDNCRTICLGYEPLEEIVDKNIKNRYVEEEKLTRYYDVDSYYVEKAVSYELKDQYKLTNNSTIDKVVFIPNQYQFDFLIGKEYDNKEFVIVFLQKSNEQLNISYSNIYILNTEEIQNKYLCEANRKALTFFCNKFLNPECRKLKSCFNEYELNFDDIDISGFIYSNNLEARNSIITSGDYPNNVSEKIESDNSAEQNNTTENLPESYYTALKNTGLACSNAGLSVGQWGCVCTSYKGIKSVVAAKCTSNLGLVLYDKATCNSNVDCKNALLSDNKKATTCYNESSALCR